MQLSASLWASERARGLHMAVSLTWTLLSTLGLWLKCWQGQSWACSKGLAAEVPWLPPSGNCKWSATLSWQGTFQTKSLFQIRASRSFQMLRLGPGQFWLLPKMFNLIECNFREKMLISQVSFCIKCVFIYAHKSMR